MISSFCFWYFKNILALMLYIQCIHSTQMCVSMCEHVSCIKQSPQRNKCLLDEGSVILLDGFQGVNPQASWIRVLWRSGTQTFTCMYTLVLAVVSVGRDTELVFVSEQSPLMFSSILLAVPSLFPPIAQREPVSRDVELI